MASFINRIGEQRKKREGELTYSVYNGCIDLNTNPCRAGEKRGEEVRGKEAGRNTIPDTDQELKYM